MRYRTCTVELVARYPVICSADLGSWYDEYRRVESSMRLVVSIPSEENLLSDGMAASKYFLGWDRQAIESALKSMDSATEPPRKFCRQLLELLSSSYIATEGVKMASLFEKEKVKVTYQECLWSLHSTKFEVDATYFHQQLEK